MARSDELLNIVVEVAGDAEFSDIDAISVGGSVGRGESDKYSDVDLFVLVTESDLHGYATRQIPRFIERIAGNALKRGPVYVSGFGYSATLVFDDLSVSQLNFNNYSTVSISPVWAVSHRVLIDRSGHLADIMSASTGVVSDPAHDYIEAYKYFWIRGLFAVRSLRRHELWRALGYLSEMRVPMLTILRLRLGKYKAGLARSPLTRLENEVGGSDASAISFMAPSYNEASIASSLCTAARWFHDQARLVTHHSRLDAADKAIAAGIRQEIGALQVGEGSS